WISSFESCGRLSTTPGTIRPAEPRYCNETGACRRCSPGRGAARPARPEQLEGVRDVREAVLGGDRIGPALDVGAVDLDRGATLAAHEVVVVRLALAPAVERLAVCREEHVDVARVRERLHRAVDRREAHARPARTQQVVQLLRTAELPEPAEQLDDLRTLAGLTLRAGHAASFRRTRQPRRGPLGVRNPSSGGTVRAGRTARATLHERTRDPWRASSPSTPSRRCPRARARRSPRCSRTACTRSTTLPSR